MISKQSEPWRWHEELNNELYGIRKHLHQYPELSFQEENTQKYICACLERWGIPYQKMSDTGIVVDIWGEKGDGKHIALRADIDALPIEERSDVSFPSKNKGVMHACGHDGHTTILLGAINHLWKYKSKLSGLVRCIFQPGEEAEGAAKKMIADGVLKNPNIESVIALHLWPKLPFGSIGLKTEAVTAACDDFVIEIAGEGGHAARPHQSIDAIAIGVEVVHALKFITTKWCDPVDPAIIHVGRFDGGKANNIVADKVVIEGTIRTISSDVRKKMKDKFIELVSGITKQFGGDVKVDFFNGHPAVINDVGITKQVKESAEEIVGVTSVYDLEKPSMGADDFGYFSELIPSTYFRLGIKEEGKEIYDLHHPKFYFNKEIIPIGSKVLTNYAVNCLKTT
ncbi:M20 family metallopeptidase [Virgibacillus sp. C22-A2]|uniref:M20 family metallopeptidase n=1 Tax=Virgibacillus tibetensis TaxID=3042313 RepID=A0ABU6KEG4_9BACI|nr:M20 family metallopeptidase [Virgibacillus sp. C22-A2]